MSQKSLFLYLRDLVVSPVSRHFPYGNRKMTKVIIFKGFCRFPVSRHFPYSKNLVISPVSRNFRIQGIWSFLLFPEPFRIQKCLETVKRQIP